MRRNELNYLSDRLDKIDNELDDINKVLVIQEENLKLHMRRSELLEEQVRPLNQMLWASYGVLGLITFIGTVLGILQFWK